MNRISPILNGKAPDKMSKAELVDRVEQLKGLVHELTPDKQDPLDKVMTYGAFTLAGLLLLLSIPHVSHGLGSLTGLALWECWILAIFLDVVQTFGKLYLVSGIHKSNRTVQLVSLGMIVFPVAVSIQCNVLAFTAHGALNGWIPYGLGFALPVMTLICAGWGVWKLEQK